MRLQIFWRYLPLSLVFSLAAFAQTNPLLGSWERISLSRDGAAQQPPENSEIVIFGADGHFMQSQLAVGWAKGQNPQSKMTQAERFDHVAASHGPYTVAGNVLTRKHVADLDPNSEGVDVVRQFRIEGETLILQGSNADGSKIEARFHKLPVLDSKPNVLVGTWERMWLIRDGVLQQPPSVPEYVVFSPDGYFMQMEIPPPGRPKVQKPLMKMTEDEVATRFAHVAVASGTYAIAASIVTRKHLRTDSPTSEGYEQVRGFRFENELLRMRGPNSNATEADAWFRRVK
jgi:hypothetical protein